MSLDAQINIGNVVPGSAAKPSAINGTYFYARWTGYLIPSVSGVHNIGVNAQDGVNLFIGHDPLILSLGSSLTANSTLGYNASGKIDLQKGVPYPITLEWQHGSGASYELQLIWTPPGGSAQLVPSANLSTSASSITNNIAGSWWNGTPGLWYPNGTGVVDATNPALPSFSPPKNLGTVPSVTTAIRAVSNAITAPARDGVTFTAPGWFGAWVYVSAGLVDIFLDCGSNTGYFFRSDGRFGFPLGSLIKVPNVTSAPTYSVIGTAYQGNNAINFTGWVFMECYFGNGYLALWVNGTKHSDALDSSYTPLASNNLAYGNEVNALGQISPATSTPGSTYLNSQGSMIPAQPIQAPAYASTTSSITFSAFSQSVLFADGSSRTITFSGASYTGLTAGHTYFFYPCVNLSTLTVIFVNSNPPGQTASSTFAVQQNSDGRLPMAPFSVVVPLSGGGSGGGGSTCPERSELVDVEGKGPTPATLVLAGYRLRGKRLKTGEGIYRTVISKREAPCGAWRIVNGHKLSPCEPVWDGAAWTPAFKMPGNTFNGNAGIKAEITVQADEYDECNFYVLGPDGSETLIHNQVLPS